MSYLIRKINSLLRVKYLILSFLALTPFMFSQISNNEIKEGKVGYTSSQFIYVNFDNTKGISEGDTLYTKSKNKLLSALIVKHISSSSAACEKINNDNFKKDMVVYARYKTKENTIIPESDTLNLESSINVVTIQESTINSTRQTITRDNIISGRYSVQSYAGFSNLDKKYDYLRWRHSLMFGFDKIGGSGLSFSSYAFFAYRVEDWAEVSKDLSSALKIYDLNLKYEFDESTIIWIGRYLNRKITNISVVDGVQFQKSFPFLTIGLVAGSRPDFYNFGINTKLFEYGIYLNRTDQVGSNAMENTLAYFEQTNDFKTDRRFVYFQHNNNLINKTNLFASTEIDIYKVENGSAESNFSLTSLYLSARYTPIEELSFSLSYDARKNIIYYETFKSLVDSILENETRQGFRARTIIRPWNSIYLTLQYGYRYSKSDSRPSDNYGGSLSFNNIPILDASAMADFNRLQSSYVDGYVYSFNLSKYLTVLQSDFSVGLRKTDYSFLNNSSKLEEKALLINFSTFAFRPFSFSIGYEGVFEDEKTYNRILLDLTTRF